MVKSAKAIFIFITSGNYLKSERSMTWIQ